MQARALTPAGPPSSARRSPTPSRRSAPGRLRGTGPRRLDLRRLRVRRGRAARLLRGLGPELGGAVADHAAQAGRHPAARPDQRHGRLVEAVNTVVFTEDGRRLGDNTDIPGMVAALRERGIEQVDSAAILGAGATASSALAALARICTGEVVAYVRSEARAAEMRQWGERLGVEVRTADWADAAEALDAPLVIATTPAGATDALAARRTGAPRDPLRRALRPLADRPGGPLVGVRRRRGRRPRPAGAPGGAPGRADDRPARPRPWRPCARRASTRSRPLTHLARRDLVPLACPRPSAGPATGSRRRTWEDRRRRAGAAHLVAPLPYARTRVRRAVPGREH